MNRLYWLMLLIVLVTGSAMSVFHSLEDRVVKRFFKQQSTAPSIPRGLPVREADLTVSIRLRTVGKAIKAGMQELTQNPRSRSATLRVAERVS